MLHRRQAGLVDTVTALLKAGADATSSDTKGNTILSWACRGGLVEMVKFLLENDSFDVHQPVLYGASSQPRTLLLTATGNILCRIHTHTPPHSPTHYFPPKACGRLALCKNYCSTGLIQTRRPLVASCRSTWLS